MSFFVMLPTEKERALCVCWLCLNVRMLYHTLYSKPKKDGDKITYVITEFPMNFSECFKDTKRFCSWKCVTQKCQHCKSGTFPQLKCQTSTDHAEIYQFEKTQKLWLPPTPQSTPCLSFAPPSRVLPVGYPSTT